MNTKVVLYGRISKDRANETSTETQMRDMRAMCDIAEYAIVGEFTDYGKSAFKLDIERDQFEAAMAMIESGQASKLIVWKLDRMSRNARAFMRINDRLEKAGATFQSVKEPWFDTSTPIGLALVMLMAALAEMEAEGIQARALGYHEGRKQNSRTPTGPRPYGYTREQNGNHIANALFPNPKEAAIIVEVAVRVINGESLRGIARDLDARNVPTISGKGWNHSTLRTVLLNPTTAGLTRDGTASDNWSAILDRETWDHIATILNDPERTSHIEAGKEARKLKHLLPGIMECGRCGGRMVTKSHKRGRQYGCETCDLSIMADIADNTVTDWVMANVSESDWQSLLTQGQGNDPRVIASIEAKIAAVDSQFRTDAISTGRWMELTADFNEQLEAATIAPAVKVPNVPNLHNGWADMSNLGKRQVIEATIGNIKVLPYGKGCTGTDRIEIQS